MKQKHKKDQRQALVLITESTTQLLIEVIISHMLILYFIYKTNDSLANYIPRARRTSSAVMPSRSTILPSRSTTLPSRSMSSSSR